MGVQAHGKGHVTEHVLRSEVDAFPRVRNQLDVGYGWVLWDSVKEETSLSVLERLEIVCKWVSSFILYCTV